MMKRTTENQGFSLLEVMIALAIFSISIVALYGIQTMTVTQNYTASRITTATTWAADKIEEIISLDYDDVAGGEEDSPDGVYTIKWDVVDNVPILNTKTVHVQVETQRKGAGSLVELRWVKQKQ